MSDIFIQWLVISFLFILHVSIWFLQFCILIALVRQSGRWGWPGHTLLLVLTHIPGRSEADCQRTDASCIFMLLPGTLRLWTVEGKVDPHLFKSWKKRLQHRLDQTSELILHIAAIRSNPLWRQHKIQLSQGLTDKSRNDTSHISYPAEHQMLQRDFPFYLPVCSSLPHKHAVGGPQREGEGGQAAAAFRLRTCWNLPPLTNKWSERLAKSNILFKHTLSRWRCGPLLSARNRKVLGRRRFG